MARRQHLTLTLMGVMLFLTLIYYMSSSSSGSRYPTMEVDSPWDRPEHSDSQSDSAGNPALGVPDSILQGGSIAPKLENATAK